MFSTIILHRMFLIFLLLLLLTMITIGHYHCHVHSMLLLLLLLVLVVSTLVFSTFVMHDKNDINSLVVDSFDMDFNTQD